MTNIEHHLQQLTQLPLSIIIHTNSETKAMRVISNCFKSAIKFIAITLSIPNAYQVIALACQQFPNAIISARTILTIKEAQQAFAARTKYLVSPIYSFKILKWSLKNDVLYAPRVMTVNEMYHAHINGAKLLKCYRVSAYQPQILSLISQPFANFTILATRRVNLKNMMSYFNADILAVRISDKWTNQEDNESDIEIANLATKYVNEVKKNCHQRKQNNGT